MTDSSDDQRADDEAGTGSPDSISVGADAVLGDDAVLGGVEEKAYPTRAQVMMAGLRSCATVGLQIVLVAAALWVLFWVLGKFWVILLPVLLAIIVCTILWPPVRWMRNHGVPAAAASLLMMLIGLGVLGGVIGLIVPSIVDQAPELANRATDGVKHLQDWVQGPPLNIEDEQLDNIVNAITSKLQSSASTIASGVFSGVGTATSLLVTVFTTFVLVFFFLKDGPKFVPWLDRSVGKLSGTHVGEVLTRMWNSSVDSSGRRRSSASSTPRSSASACSSSGGFRSPACWWWSPSSAASSRSSVRSSPERSPCSSPSCPTA